MYVLSLHNDFEEVSVFHRLGPLKRDYERSIYRKGYWGVF
jgi:hypothetical protein